MQLPIVWSSPLPMTSPCRWDANPALRKKKQPQSCDFSLPCCQHSPNDDIIFSSPHRNSRQMMCKTTYVSVGLKTIIAALSQFNNPVSGHPSEANKSFSTTSTPATFGSSRKGHVVILSRVYTLDYNTCRLGSVS